MTDVGACERSGMRASNVLHVDILIRDLCTALCATSDTTGNVMPELDGDGNRIRDERNANGFVQGERAMSNDDGWSKGLKIVS